MQRLPVFLYLCSRIPHLWQFLYQSTACAWAALSSPFRFHYRTTEWCCCWWIAASYPQRHPNAPILTDSGPLSWTTSLRGPTYYPSEVGFDYKLHPSAMVLASCNFLYLDHTCHRSHFWHSCLDWICLLPHHLIHCLISSCFRGMHLPNWTSPDLCDVSPAVALSSSPVRCSLRTCTCMLLCCSSRFCSDSRLCTIRAMLISYLGLLWVFWKLLCLCRRAGRRHRSYRCSAITLICRLKSGIGCRS